MKTFRLTLSAILSALVLLGALQLQVRAAAPSASRQLRYADRVAYQRALEEVYWRHRIWPQESPVAKPPLDAVMSPTAIEQKVADYLRLSTERESHTPITPTELQAEMDRMAEQTRQPEVLRELFAALGDDPFVIAECLARPVLVERLRAAAGERLQKPARASRTAKQEALPQRAAAVPASYAMPTVSGRPSDCSNSWTATSTTGAPLARKAHTAVWTGTEMIIWGGQNIQDAPFNTGGRYTPSTDSWAATSMTNVPSARFRHTAIWTGTEMIVWGGFPGTISTGGRYNPSTDSWTPTSTLNAPSGRANHTAVWTGSEMIIWGGYQDLNTGGIYHPDTDSWTPTSTTNAPSGRALHTAVWTGHEMIVWGGVFDGNRALRTGGRYDPGTDSWTATTTTSAPTHRYYHTAVWTGSDMIIWGGYGASNTGWKYHPETDSWTATTTTNAPTSRYQHTAVWTGTHMIIWGGNFLETGGNYNPAADTWSDTSTTNAPTGTFDHSAVWTGSEMIVWGGYDFPEYLNSGGRYCPPAAEPFTLEVATSKVGGINTALLTWSGATSTDIDIYRDGVLVATTPNNGSYTDSTGDTGRGRYRYRVCEAGTTTCSNNVIVKFRE